LVTWQNIALSISLYDYFVLLQNKKSVSRYLQDWLDWSHQQRKLQAANPHPAAERLRKLKAEQDKQAVLQDA
jgi:hypothetical protein